MAEHVVNRDSVILQSLAEELIGPSPQGTPLDCSKPLVFDDMVKAAGPWKQAGSGEEILQRDPPTKRYGVGVLYPTGVSPEPELEAATDPGEGANGSEQNNRIDEAPQEDGSDGSVTGALSTEAINDLEDIEKRSGRRDGDGDNDDFDLTSANAYKPSSMGVTFLVDLSDDTVISVSASGGRYRKINAHIGSAERVWWLRSPVKLEGPFSGLDLAGVKAVRKESSSGSNTDGLDLRIEVYSRPYKGRKRLITVCLVNRKPAQGRPDEDCLFQAELSVSVISPDGRGLILPYPSSEETSRDEEDEAINLLYRDAKTFAVGHGCAANWENENTERVSWVKAETLPVYEAPGITANIVRGDGSRLEVSMAALAGLVENDDGMASLNEIVALYQKWLDERASEIPLLAPEHQAAARRHMDACTRCIDRMRDGISYLSIDARALRAFRLANHAILLQQVHGRREARKISYDPAERRYKFSEEYKSPDLLRADKGKWRAFQIAFLLMSIRSAADGKAPDRDAVELIWFPTGGGKTEAYLGLAAFSAFMRRLDDPEDTGVHVLMRYTLRLLTAQQFQRASGLLCAMEYLRRQHPGELGSGEFSIGIWLGGGTTPNTRRDALSILSELKKGDKQATNKFIISRCPWCGAQIGPAEFHRSVPKSITRCPGYEQHGTTVSFHCTDNTCEFSAALPIYVIDEDIYDKRPTLVIGTVDKFAMLAWRPKARAIFGIGESGNRISSPPGLIIQDELHLISGPLGSMVGLYEAVIEELCTDRREGVDVKPKIVCSTATIRKYQEQIKALYGRDDAVLFPPPGLAAGDSFFAMYDRDAEGKLRPGRKYVGVHAPGLGSLQTVQVRTFTALLQAPVPLTPAERDPWWTFLVFFNSLRELGTTLSLFQSDIPDYQGVIRNRFGLKPQNIRYLRGIIELTGRLRGDEVSTAIDLLDVTTESTSAKPVDVCLASNIIEVGVDIDRLSLMSIVGQPKTTAQYIQVSGRVGRRPDRPGLVVTIYGASKPRDRSHFEKFRSYHERLYGQVEPTSVTPFSPPSIDRALHAVMAVFARQAGSAEQGVSPYPFPDVLISNLKSILMSRVNAVDPQEIGNFEKVFNKRVTEWVAWERTIWEKKGQDDSDAPLLREAGAYASRERANVSWPTPMSLRNVDAECEVEVTQLYAQEEVEDNE